MAKLCRCGHLATEHAHYRPGAECAFCADCRRYRPARWWHRRRRMARPAAIVDDDHGAGTVREGQRARGSAATSTRRWWWRAIARSAAVTVVMFIDHHIWTAALPRVLVGVLDEMSHLATALLLLSAWRPLRTYGWRLLVGTLSAAVLIDLDHVPSELFQLSFLTAGTYRPYGHTLLVILLVLAISALPRRRSTRRVVRGVALGFALHLTRDLPTGGVALFWPLTNHTVTYPYPLYLMLLFGAAVTPPLVAVRHDIGALRAPSPKAAPPAVFGGDLE